MDITNYLQKKNHKLFVKVKTLLRACFPCIVNIPSQFLIVIWSYNLFYLLLELNIIVFCIIWFSALSDICVRCLPMLDKTGPNALASAPRDRNTPITTPFWSVPPNPEISVVRHGTTVADAAKQGATLIFLLQFIFYKFYLEKKHHILVDKLLKWSW